MTIYILDAFGRATGETIENRGMECYRATGFIPRHLTDITPLPSKEGFDVVFNGSTWNYVDINSSDQ